MNNSILFSLVAIVFLALLAGTVRALRNNLIRRPADETRPVIAAILGLFECVLWLSCILACFFAVPHPEPMVLVALIVVSIMVAGALKYREERSSFNRWLLFATNIPTPLPRLLEHLSTGVNNGLALRIKAFTKRIHRGERLLDAARRAKVPIDPDALAGLDGKKPALTTTERRKVERIPEDYGKMALGFQHFAYVIVMMVLAWLISMYVRSLVIAMFDEMFHEFSVEYGLQLEHSRRGLDRAVLIGHCFIVLLTLWLMFAAMVRWMPFWMIRLLPWFGDNAIQRWRGEVLRSLGRGMRFGQSTNETLRAASHSNPVRWIRRHCGEVERIVDSGTSLSVALHQGGLISACEAEWLSCAERNGTLAAAVNQLSSDIPRRQANRWQIRMAWFLPLGTVLVGMFILMHSLYLFRFLSSLIQGLS